MKDKGFTTFDQQIEILKDRGVIFHSEEASKKALQRFGYYNIINGYKDPYIDCPSEDEKYILGTSFEQIYSLYTMDRGVRNAILDSTLEVEDMLRNAIAHVLSESFGTEEELYLDKNNYKTGNARKNGFKRDDILRKFNKILSGNEEPIQYYRNTYGNVPPWILLKGASFGNLVNFLKLQKAPQKDKILSLFSGLPIQTISNVQVIKDFLMDLLFVCLDYRNRAAHGWRVYNYESPSTFRYSPIFHTAFGITQADYRNGIGKTGVSVLLQGLKLLDNNSPAASLYAGIKVNINRHLSTYPDDEAYLKKYLYAIFE